MQKGKLEGSSTSTNTSTQTLSVTSTSLDGVIMDFFTGIRPHLRPFIQLSPAPYTPPHMHHVNPTPYASRPQTTSTTTHATPGPSTTSTTTHSTPSSPIRFLSHYHTLVTFTPIMPPAMSPLPPPGPIPKKRRRTSPCPSIIYPNPNPPPCRIEPRPNMSTITHLPIIYPRPTPPLFILSSSALRPFTQAHPMRHPIPRSSTPPLRHIQPCPTASTITGPTNTAPMPASPGMHSTPHTSQPFPSTYSLVWSTHYSAFTVTSTYLSQHTLQSKCRLFLTHMLSTLPPTRSRTVGTHTQPQRTRRHSIEMLPVAADKCI